MRIVIAALVAVLTAACVDVKTDDGAEAAAEGYTLEVRANDGVQVFMVTAPDGRMVAGRAADGVSALMDASSARQLAATPGPAADDLHEVVSLRVPGLDLSISGNPDHDGEDGGGRVAINAGGHSIEVNAVDGGPGDGDDRAHVRITGVSEADAREFIAKADELSPAVQAQMLAGLGLE